MSKEANCFSKKDASLTIEQAKERCFQAINQTLVAEKVTTRLGLNRVLSEDIIAPINVPNFNNSAMDGYALRTVDIKNNTFTVIATAYAGKPIDKILAKNECIQVMTGALIPENADKVVPQEYVKRQGNQITIEGYEGGDNIRLVGEDLTKGAIILKKGQALNPADLGLLASLGIAEISVSRPLRVAFFSTGDELRSLTETLKMGEIYDSNRYSLFGLLSNLKVDLLDMGVVKDDYDALKTAFIAASNAADIVITTGGVSVGEADFVKQVLSEIGEVDFWKLAIKPGRPLTFGKINQAYFFGLPGNPVATMITFYQIVTPFLKTLRGQTQNTDPLSINAISHSDIFKSQGRTEFLRAIFSSDNGEVSVKKLDKQGSGVLSSMSLANCLIVLSADMGSVKKGDIVQIQPFYGLI